MALTFSGFASIPLCETINPRNFPEETSKAHLDGVQLHVVLSEGIERLSKIVQVVLLVSAFDKHIVDVHLDIPPNLFFEHLVY